MREFTCVGCGTRFRTAQEMVRAWPIDTWWKRVGQQCMSCRMVAQGEPAQETPPPPPLPARIDTSTSITAAGSLTAARMTVLLERDQGIRCPCCDQLAKVYKRHLNRSMVLALVDMFRAGGITTFVHTPSVLGSRRGEEARLSYWGLTTEQHQTREDGGRRGYWRVTRKGELFLMGVITVPRTAHVYNAECLRVDGDATSVAGALGTPFNLRELMAG